MILHRPAAERGHADHGWLKTAHTFSFADYHDPAWMGFGSLRVINEDRIAGKKGFGPHPHRDMEILTYVLTGALEHQDSMGNGSVIRPNHLQYMSAGTGVMHSEINPENEEVHLLQIWIEPDTRGLPPRYAEKELGTLTPGVLQLIASENGGAESIVVRQKMRLYRGITRPGDKIVFSSQPGRIQWIQVIEGNLGIDSVSLQAGDGCGVTAEPLFTITTTKNAHFLLFDL
ncbi:MAG: hypothetical protein RL141_837 [Candidatus Parcubacteria bacterium]|jgi:redox-sensitive bicupin YhaK (pirin superfamily)